MHLRSSVLALVMLTSSILVSCAGVSTSSTSGTGGEQPPEKLSVTLSWNPSTSAVAGYNIYRAVQSGGPYSKMNASLLASTTYIDTSIQGGMTYYYVSTAMTFDNIESAYSNEATAAVP